MKTSYIAILAAALAITGTLTAQTNTNTPVSAPSTSVWSSIGTALLDTNSFFGTNTSLVIDGGALYSQKQWGELLAIHAPLPLGTNGQVAVGLAALYIGNQFYDSAISLKLNKTWKPFGHPVLIWGEEGVGVNFHTHAAIAQSFAGATTGFDLYKGTYLYLTGMVGDISDRSGVAYGGAVGVNVSKKALTSLVGTLGL